MNNKLNKKCPKCGNDDWTVTDSDSHYSELCIHCCYSHEIRKRDFELKF